MLLKRLIKLTLLIFFVTLYLNFYILAWAGPKTIQKLSNTRLYNKVYTLCIGIDKYWSGQIDELKYAVSDAKAMASLFKEHYNYYKVEKLLNNEASKDIILKKLKSYKDILKKEDALLIFFAGHGQTVENESYGRTGYLVPFDAELNISDTRDPEQWKDEAISMFALGEITLQINARHILMIVDACYSGFLGKRSGLENRPDYQQLILHPSRMVITAGTEDQQSWESDKLKHGFFSSAIIEELRQNRAAGATEIFVAVRSKVSKMTNKRMLPQLREIIIGNGEFVFLPKSISDDKITESLMMAEKFARKRGAKSTKLKDLFEIFEAFDYQYSNDAPKLEKKWKKKKKRFEDNSMLGDPLAMASLFHYYRKRLFNDKDKKMAYSWAQKAYDTGHPSGIHALAICYLEGIKVVQNRPAAIKLLEEANTHKFPLSQYQLANLTLSDFSNKVFGNQKQFSKEKKEQLLTLFTNAANAGLSSAQYELGLVLKNGLAGIQKDLNASFQWFQKAAMKQNLLAYLELGKIYYNGLENIIKQDFEKAKYYLLKAAECGNDEAKRQLAGFYLGLQNFDIGIPKDFTKAKLLLESASEQGNSRAMVDLATEILIKGKGVPKNYDKAFEYLTRAARLNNGYAYVGLGNIYYDGIYKEKDVDKAIANWKKAGELGAQEGFINSYIYYKYENNYSQAILNLLKAKEINDNEDIRYKLDYYKYYKTKIYERTIKLFQEEKEERLDLKEQTQSDHSNYEKLGHSDDVITTIIDSTNKYIVSGSYDNTIKIWELDSGNLLNTLTVDILNFQITPNGKFVVSKFGDKKLKIWELYNAKLFKTLTINSKKISSFQIVPNGKFIVLNCDYELNIWALDSGKLNTLSEDCLNCQYKIDQKGEFVVALKSNRCIYVWELATGLLLNTVVNPTIKIWGETLHYLIESFMIDSIGKVIIAGEIEHSFHTRLINETTSEKIDKALSYLDLSLRDHLILSSIKIKDNIKSFATDPTERYVIGIGKEKLFIIDCKNDKIVATINDEFDEFVDLKSKYVVTKGNRFIKKWDLMTGNLLKSIKINYCCSRISISYKYIVGASGNNLYIWSLATGLLLKKIENVHYLKIHDFRIDATDKYIVTGGDDNKVKVWDIQTGKIKMAL